MVATTTISVARANALDERLRQNGPRVRSTSTTSEADTTDSTNQPVRNNSGDALRIKNSVPKVMKSKTELSKPNRSMKLRINLISQCCGRCIASASTRSVAMVISGKSVNKLVSRICLGSNGRKGNNSEAPAILNMLPKLALVAIKTYFCVLANVLRPSRTPAVSTARSGSSNTMSAASLATPAAPCTDRPTSATCSAGASLMPSPM